MARALLALGIRKGDRVAVWANNRPEWVLLQFALAKISAVLVTVNTALRRAELKYLLRQSDAVALLLVPFFREVNFLEELCAIVPEIWGAPPGAWHSSELPLLREVVLLAVEGPDQAGLPTGARSWDDVCSMAEAVPDGQLDSIAATLALDEVINMQYTSGTTGFPKGVMLTHRNIVNNAYLTSQDQQLTWADRLCAPVPLFHCFGCVIAVLGVVTHGATLLLIPQFEPVRVLEMIQRERATVLFGVPTMFLAELEHPNFARFDLSSLRTGIMAGALCPRALLDRVMREMHLPELTVAYGLTEASPAVTQTRSSDPLDLRLTTVGRPLPGLEVKIADPADGRPIPPGAAGELWTRGEHVMAGYYKDEAATRAAITPDGWLRTGDLATMGEAGYVTIVGRLKDMIIRGGENIYPKEIEDLLRQHSAVSDVAVVGVPSRRYGEEVAAAVRLRSGQQVTAEQLQQFCVERLAAFKVPKYLWFVEAFPQTASGKIQKFRLREQAVAEFHLEAAR